ncbi:class I SAM-dependent methyltransferase [Candidatus Oscillochloris fontis]|uniref:class I SAM-dependent methyltransferase n=1 Tax=Candidatus Oscillochloris fontis TaxID=2496868 RepID=UPI00101C7172|nr:class I SAM-dependent methyltransferase [Candidatus Oscillochloris fontis]
MNIYTSYAPIYDMIGQAGFSQHLVTHILAALPTRPQRVLDLACGTGGAALILAQAGAQVVGLDRSAAMLRIARARARDLGLAVRWVHADMRRMLARSAVRQLLHPASFDLVTCLYDSLNYLTGPADLGLVCASVANLLRPGGQFVFDLNTEYEFASWDDTDQVVYDSSDMLVYNRLNYNARTRLAKGQIVWFVREVDRWWRGEEVHTERAWCDAEVQAAVEAAGMQILARYTPTWQPAPPDAARVVHVCGVPT